MVVLAATIATAATTQMAIVRQPWRAQARARRARAPSWTRCSATVEFWLMLNTSAPTCRTVGGEARRARPAGSKRTDKSG